MSISIAIVEDLDEVRNGLKSFLSLSEGFAVLDTFTTAEEALYDIPKLKPDIVIMDINLPGMNGIECIRQVKSKVPLTQFMMFTVYENDEKVFEALKAGASGYLLKNTGLVQLIESLKLFKKTICKFDNSKNSPVLLIPVTQNYDNFNGVKTIGLQSYCQKKID